VTSTTRAFAPGNRKCVDVSISFNVDTRAWVGYLVLWTVGGRFANLRDNNGWIDGDSMWFAPAQAGLGFNYVQALDSRTLNGVAGARVAHYQRTDSIFEVRYDAEREDYVIAGRYLDYGLAGDPVP
jgi:hypothetical protein